MSLRTLLRRWRDAIAPIDATDHAPCAWACSESKTRDRHADPDEPPGICFSLDLERERADLEHRIAIDAAVVVIEAHCVLSHRDDDGANWWRLDYLETTETDADSIQQAQRDVARAALYLDLCGLIEITHGDVRIARLRKEWIP